jgi:Na+/proline symporter
LNNFYDIYNARIEKFYNHINPILYKILAFGSCLLFVLISDLAKVVLAGILRPKLTEKTLVRVNRVSGIIILIFSAVLFYGALTY